MKISDYLREMRLAIETVIRVIHTEQNEVARLERELKPLEAATSEGYSRAEFFAMNPDLDDEGLGTLCYYETYFGPDKQRHQKAGDLEATKAALEAHALSIDSMAGSLLQYAKQGIALRFGKNRNGCSDGRTVAGMPLHEVIWQGRNQAMHWEEGHFNAPVERCFAQLSREADASFEAFHDRSMAYDLVRLLGWQSFEDFENDMKLFGE